MYSLDYLELKVHVEEKRDALTNSQYQMPDIKAGPFLGHPDPAKLLDRMDTRVIPSKSSRTALLSPANSANLQNYEQINGGCFKLLTFCVV